MLYIYTVAQRNDGTLEISSQACLMWTNFQNTSTITLAWKFELQCKSVYFHITRSVLLHYLVAVCYRYLTYIVVISDVHVESFSDTSQITNKNQWDMGMFRYHFLLTFLSGLTEWRSVQFDIMKSPLCVCKFQAFTVVNFLILGRFAYTAFLGIF